MSIKPNKFFVVIIILGLMANGCGTSANQIGNAQEVQTLANQIENTKEVQTLVAGFLTETAEPTRTSLSTSIPFVMPTGNFQMSWNTYNSEYDLLGGIVTIRRQGSKYTEKIVMSDGSNGTFDLSVISEGGEIKLSGNLGDPYSLYPHDYIQIESNGWLGFYDDQGLIYSVPLLTSIIQTPSASDYLTQTANPTTTPSPAPTPDLSSALEKCVDSPGVKYVVKNNSGDSSLNQIEISVTLQNDLNGTEQGKFVTPYCREFQGFNTGDFLYISAQINSEGFGEQVECIIYDEDQIVSQSTASGFASIATCSTTK